MNEKSINSGFTLVELIVVIAIIAILVAIAVPMVSGYVLDAQNSGCLSERETLASQYQMDYSDASAISKMTQASAQATADLAAQSLGATGTYPKYLGLCPSGGTFTVKVNASGSISVTCSLHGAPSGLNNVLPPFVTNFDDIIDIAKNGTNISGVDSTAPSGNNNYLYKIEAYFKANNIDLSELNIKTWSIKKEGNLPVIWWTDQDVSKLNPGDTVRVMRYNPGKTPPTFTAGYTTVSTNTLNGVTYNVITGFSSWKESPPNQKDKTKYNSAVDAFNGLDETK